MAAKARRGLRGRLAAWFFRVAHFVYGVFTVYSAYVAPLLPLVMFLSFASYEVSEYVKKHDTLYLEFRDYAAGIAFGVILKYLGEP